MTILADLEGACDLARMRVHRSIGQRIRHAHEVNRVAFEELRESSALRFDIIRFSVVTPRSDNWPLINALLNNHYLTQRENACRGNSG